MISQSDPPVIAQFNLTRAQPADGLRVDTVLLVQHSRRERLLGVAAQHRDGGLDDDRAMVEVGCDEVHRAAVDTHAVVQGSRMRVEAAVGWQQRRVDVDQSAVIARHETRAEDAHETRQHHEIRMEGVDEPGQRGIEALAIRVVAVLDDGGRDAARLRDLQPAGIGAVADHRRDAAEQPRFQQGLQVAASAGDEDDDGLHL